MSAGFSAGSYRPLEHASTDSNGHWCMQDNPDNNNQPASQRTRYDHGGFHEQRTMNRWQYRADQIQLRQQQVQSEMSTTVLVATNGMPVEEP